MKVCTGKSVFAGIAIGKLHVYQKNEYTIKRTKISDCNFEIQKFHKARELSIEQLEELHNKALTKVGEANAAIFEIHQMMLEDLDYINSVENIISSQSINVEYAVATTSDNFAKMFSSMDDDYMQARAADVKDISERILSNLNNNQQSSIEYSEPVIILAEDLTPSETLHLDKDKVLSFVTVKGSKNSHTAILAKTMSIPSLIGTDIELDASLNGKKAIVDGFSGTIYIDPTDEILEHMQNKLDNEIEKKSLLHQLKGKQNITLDGKNIMLYANIGDIKDLVFALQNDAGGIGLFRSEFIYLEKHTYPTENEQFQIYKTVAETMAGKRVIIRTLDIGADKQASYFNLSEEENPALGYRAIRICLKRKDIFKTQLRALFRASIYGNISIMYPMIISLDEILKIKEIVSEVKSELTAEGIPFKEVEQGIMIETPAAVIISDILAKEVDFFSIGTNDLSQYTMAIDRQNPNLDDFFNPHHTAILRMIKMVADNAHKNNIWVGICGELSSDLDLTEFFLSIGIDELSVSPSSILPLRKIIRETNISKIKEESIRILE